MHPKPADLQGSIDHVIAEVQRGDRERFGEVFVAYEPTVRVVAATILPDHAALPDLVHEVFVLAYNKIHEYQLGTDFRAWINTITRNLALNERRKILRQRQLGQQHLNDIEELFTPTLDQLASNVSDEMLSVLHQCLAGLTERSRRVVEAFYFESLPGAEIARREEKKEGWVRLTLFRAREALLTCLEKNGALGHG
jgi:RNA polymerase sigma-70 factor (ECF subfamily)